MKTSRSFSILLTLVFLATSGSIWAQDPKASPSPADQEQSKYANTEPIYVKLRKNESLGECFTVNNLPLKKDRAVFTLKSGGVCFFSPVENKVTGAIFMGDGELFLDPPVEAERKMVKLFTDAPQVKEGFTQLVMYFTDETYDQIKNSPNAKLDAGLNQQPYKDLWKKRRDQMTDNDEKDFDPYVGGVLAKYFAPDRKGAFSVSITGKKYKRLSYGIDPLGIQIVYPEQVALLSFDEETAGIWAAFHMEDEYKKGTAHTKADRRVYDITNHNIDMTVRGTRLIGKDTITMKMIEPNSRLLGFELFSPLRIKRVLNEEGKELYFFQRKKNKGSGMSVVLPSVVEVGKPFKITFEYDGLDALADLGGGNYFLGPRSSWYPSNPQADFGDRATFDMVFRYPKKNTLVAVGDLVESTQAEGDLRRDRWTSNGEEMIVAGFNYGTFEKKSVKDEETGYELEVYANKELPGYFKDLLKFLGDVQARGGTTLTTLEAATTITGMDRVLNEAQNSVRVYDKYFGKLPHKRISMTQQPAEDFGQAWPTLVYMPFLAYLDTTMRVQYWGSQGGADTFWKEVAAHEVAHQWWGHTVGWPSYHDQWMSEGFSQFSASLYIQLVKKDLKGFVDFWEGERKLIVEPRPATKDKPPYTFGPVTQGYRLTNAKAGAATRFLIYPKGGYILHMLRMMMYDKKTGDAAFQAMMKDFVASHYNKDVSTEDFKRVVEKHMTPKMDIDKNKKIDWFFDQWVYGTDVPAYKFEYNVNGTTLNAKITQSGVSNSFVMPVPIYVDYGDGWSLLGAATVSGNSAVDLSNVKLPKAPVKVGICVYNDVLYTKLETVKQ